MTGVPEIARRFIGGKWQTGVAEDGGGGSQPFDIPLAAGQACVITYQSNDLTRIEIDADTYGRIALGLSAEVTGNDGVAIGGGAVAGQTASSLGDSASAQGGGSMALGNGAVTTSDATPGASAIGASAFVSAPRATSVGYQSQATADGATAIGKDAVADAPGVTVVSGPNGTKVILVSPNASRFYLAVANDGTLSAVSIP